MEAFSFGLPCIAADGYAAEELIEDGVRGKVISNYLSLFDENYISTLKSDNMEIKKDLKIILQKLK